jgi:hypothetical protein
MAIEYKIHSDQLKIVEDGFKVEDLLGDWIEKLDTLCFQEAQPFPHVVIPNFFREDVAQLLFEEFPDPSQDGDWHRYHNPIEVKLAMDNIVAMPNRFRQTFYELSTSHVVNIFSTMSGILNLTHDPYLHGAGIHAHPRHGRLHMHLDYEKHPILTDYQRRLNVIVYLSKEWNPDWKGSTELWDQAMQHCKVRSEVQFNTAIIFQTNEVSWHGVPDKIQCPPHIFRKTLAYYYISPLENSPNQNKFGAVKDGYRIKAAFRRRPFDPRNPILDKLYKIRPYRRISSLDLQKLWPSWTPRRF